MSRELRNLLVKAAPIQIDDEIEEKGRGGGRTARLRGSMLMGGGPRGGTMGAYVAMGRGLDKARGPFGSKNKLARIHRAREFLFNRYQGGVGGRGIRTGSGYQLPPAR